MISMMRVISLLVMVAPLIRHAPDDMPPNAVDISIFDDNEERLIDGDYQVPEEYT